jgi:hypothetical protein
LIFFQALLTDSIEVAPGFFISRDEESEVHLDASDELDLPSDPVARNSRLDELLWNRALTFVRSRTINFDLQETGIDG